MSNEALIERLHRSADCVSDEVIWPRDVLREAAAALKAAEAELREEMREVHAAHLRAETAEADLAAARAEIERLTSGIKHIATPGTVAGMHDQDQGWKLQSIARALLHGEKAD